MIQKIVFPLLYPMVKEEISKGKSLRARLLPFTGKGSEIKIYVVTGLHGGIRIPESYCEECNLFVKAAKDAVQEVDQDVDIDVRSYWTRFPHPLLKGGYHPPVMLVNGELVAQGYEVPDKELIKEKLKDFRKS